MAAILIMIVVIMVVAMIMVAPRPMDVRAGDRRRQS